MMKPAQKSVLVTGAGKGLGYAILEEALKNGFHVIAVVRKHQDSQRLKRQLGSACGVIVADITSPAAEETIRKALVRKKVVLDVIINNAGVAGSGSTLEETDLRNLRKLVDVHCIGALRCTRAALDSLRKSRRPVIVNISSRLGSTTNVAAGKYTSESHSYSYRIAKASQNMATACLHAELNEQGIMVVAIHPGKLQTTLSQHSEGNTPRQAAIRLLALIQSMTAEMSGTFRDLDGNLLKW